MTDITQLQAILMGRIHDALEDVATEAEVVEVLSELDHSDAEWFTISHQIHWKVRDLIAGIEAAFVHNGDIQR